MTEEKRLAEEKAMAQEEGISLNAFVKQSLIHAVM